MDPNPSSSSAFGSPENAWSSRAYRAMTPPRPVDHDGERGVGLPARPVPLWAAAGLAVLASGAGVALVLAALLGDRPGRSASSVALALLGALGFFAVAAIAVRKAVRSRRHPAAVVVTPTRIVPLRGAPVSWEDVDSISASQVLRQHSPRPIDVAIASVDGRQVELFQPAFLACDPRAALAGLRRAHLDPAVREALGSPESVEGFTEDGGDR